MGAAMRYIDCGGGLAVDYDGSFTDSHASMSYTLQHYANDGGRAGAAGSGCGVAGWEGFRRLRGVAAPGMSPGFAAAPSLALAARLTLLTRPAPPFPATPPHPAPPRSGVSCAGGVHPARHPAAHGDDGERARTGQPRLGARLRRAHHVSEEGGK